MIADSSGASAAGGTSSAMLARLKARPLAVFLLGGVLANNARVRASLVAALKKSCPVRIEERRLSPLAGAAAMALRDAGVQLTTDVVANLAKLHSSGSR